MRPIFLASCVLACKLTRDNDLRLSDLQCRLVDVFDLLELGLLVKLEHQLLEVRLASRASAAETTLVPSSTLASRPRSHHPAASWVRCCIGASQWGV